jgi:SAM-dependent methyltransferase
MNPVSRRLPFPVRRAIRSLLPEEWRVRLHAYIVGEPGVIRTELRHLGKTPWRQFAGKHPTVRMTERVVEIPWVLSRYRGERRVLDIGSANAVDMYLNHLRGMSIPELHGVDLSAKKVRGIRMTQSDVRRMPFGDSYFDLVLCVSTLEHIGQDNSGYQISAQRDQAGGISALTEMRRVLTNEGRILVTVPFGRAQDYGWFKQYDLRTWNEALQAANLRADELVFYAYTPAGWESVEDPGVLRSNGYREGGAPASESVLCAALKR